MNAGRFVIDGLAIPANRKAQRYREYPIGPAPGSVGLARSLFSYSNLGGGGRLACGVRGSAAGFESCVHTSKTIVRGGTLSAVHTVLVLVRRSRARHTRFRGPPPPPVSQISISRGIGTTPFIPKYAKRCRWTVLGVSTRLSDKTGRREVNLGWSTVNN